MEDPCFTVLEEVFCVFAYIFVFLCLYLWICVHLDSNTSTVYDHEATLNGGSIISLQFGYLFLSFCICIFYLYLQLSSILCQCGDANVVYDYGAKPWMGNRWLTITLGNRNPQIYHRMAKVARIGEKNKDKCKSWQIKQHIKQIERNLLNYMIYSWCPLTHPPNIVRHTWNVKDGQTLDHQQKSNCDLF